MKSTPSPPPKRRWPEFRDDSSPRSPFGTQSEPRKKPKDEQEPVVWGERGEPCKNGVPQDRDHQHALAANIVSEHTGCDSAHCPSQQRSCEQAAHVH